MLKLLIVEDDQRLQTALKSGFEAIGEVEVINAITSGEEAIEFCFAHSDRIDVILMDVALAGK